MKNNYFEKVIEHFGSQTELADRLQVKKQSVSRWYNNHMPIPLIYAVKIEFLTDGKFKFIKLLDKETQCYLKRN